MGIFGEKRCIPTLVDISDISIEQAKTCLYYAIATHMLPDRLEQIPILTIIGPYGTGKSSLLYKLSEMVKEPNIIAAESTATLRDKLAGTVTALIDEGDNVHEEYLIKRYSAKTGRISYKIATGDGWSINTINIFGASIIVRRTPYKDAATTSRSIMIRTRLGKGKPNTSSLAYISEKLGIKASEVQLDTEAETSDRVTDNWAVLQAIAEYLGDTQWIEYSRNEIESATKSLKSGQKYEPEQALLFVLKQEMLDLSCGNEVIIPKNVQLSIIRNTLKSEFDLALKNVQIDAMCQSLGFRIVSHSGYPQVKHNQKLLDRLLVERHL